MYKVFIFLFISLFLSCSERNKQKEVGNTNTTDSVLFYYDVSIDKSTPLLKKYLAINKSLQFAQQKPYDSLFIKALYQKNFIHFSLKQYDSLLTFGNLLFDNANELRDSIYLGKQHHLLGYYFSEINAVPDSSFYHYNKSKGYFKNDSSQVGSRLMSMAVIQKNQNDFFGSKETLTEALRYLKPKTDAKNIASCYNTLGTNHRKLLNFDDAIKYYEKAIETTNSDKTKLMFSNNIAATLIDSNQYENAISLLKGIQKDSLFKENNKLYPRVLDNLVYAEWKLGKKVTASKFLLPLQIRKLSSDKRGQIASYTHLGEFYTQTNPKKADLYFDSVIQLSKIMKIPRAEKDALKFLMKISPKNEKLRDRYIILQDSLYANELQVKTQFAKYKYDDKLKQEFILRLEKENSEKALEASQQRSLKIMYLGGTLFLIVILGFAIYDSKQRSKRSKLKSKTEKLETIYETEAEMSRRLHDDHGGKLNQTMLLVENDVDKAKILDNLEALYNQSRDFSREINEVDTGPNFWSHLLAMIQLRTPAHIKLYLKGGKEVNWKLIAPIVKTVLFKILQELMINLGKHSKANTVAITFENSGSDLKINYEDDGIGASKNELLLKNGLLNTEKRIKAIGGSIIFESEKGNGFKAEIRVPN